MFAHRCIALLAIALLANHGYGQQCTVKQNCTVAAPDMIAYSLYAATETQCCTECASFRGCVTAIFDVTNSACHLKNTTDVIFAPGNSVIFVNPPTTPAPLTFAPTTPVPWTPSPTPNVIQGTLLWNASFDSSQVLAGPFVGEGVIVVAVQDVLSGVQHCQAFESVSGRLLWRNVVDAIPILLLGNGLVYLISLTNVVALTAGAGAQVWMAEVLVNGDVIPLLNNGVLYVATEHSTLDAMDALTGQVVWSFAADMGESTIAVDANLIYFLAYNPFNNSVAAFCLDASTGNPIWNVPVSGPTVFLVQTPLALVASDADELMALNSFSGASLWTANTNTLTPLSLLNDFLYFRETVGGVQYLVAWNASTGTPLWATSLSVTDSTMKAVGDVLYIYGANFFGLTALRASSGEVLWSVRVIVEYCHISNGTLYLSSPDGVTAVNAADGSTVWTWRAPPCRQLVLSNETVYLASNNAVVAWLLE